jgi:hypothetical protein
MKIGDMTLALGEVRSAAIRPGKPIITMNSSASPASPRRPAQPPPQPPKPTATTARATASRPRSAALGTKKPGESNQMTLLVSDRSNDGLAGLWSLPIKRALERHLKINRKLIQLDENIAIDLEFILFSQFGVMNPKFHSGLTWRRIKNKLLGRISVPEEKWKTMTPSGLAVNLAKESIDSLINVKRLKMSSASDMLSVFDPSLSLTKLARAARFQQDITDLTLDSTIALASILMSDRFAVNLGTRRIMRARNIFVFMNDIKYNNDPWKRHAEKIVISVNYLINCGAMLSRLTSAKQLRY